MLDGVSGDPADCQMNFVVMHLSGFCQHIQHQRETKPQAILAASAIDGLPQRDQHQRRNLQHQVGTQIATTALLTSVPPRHARRCKRSQHNSFEFDVYAWYELRTDPCEQPGTG